LEALEDVVLDQIVKILADPERILDEAKHLNDAEIDSTGRTAIDQELVKVEEQQRRLANLYVNGSLPQDILETKSNELSQKRLGLESRKRSIEVSTPNPVDLDHLTSILPEAVSRLRQWIKDASKDDMELILRALDVQITASREQVQITGCVPAVVPEGEDLVTIVQTSA